METVYFTKDNPMVNTIKGYVVSQCTDVCRNEISNTVASHTFNQFDFGYFHKTQRLGKKDCTVNSFVLVKYFHQPGIEVPFSVDILLLCSSKNNVSGVDGERLLKMVEEKCISEGIKKITLSSLGKEKLRNWYIHTGFHQISEKLLDNNKVKVYNMIKFL